MSAGTIASSQNFSVAVTVFILAGLNSGSEPDLVLTYVKTRSGSDPEFPGYALARRKGPMHRILLALALLTVCGTSAAQYPNKPLRFIVGFPPGGSADPTTRILGQALSEQMGQPVVVDNRPGADSAIAAEQMTRIAPDGYTIMFASNSA